jgi:hypothetical protein
MRSLLDTGTTLSGRLLADRLVKAQTQRLRTLALVGNEGDCSRECHKLGNDAAD